MYLHDTNEVQFVYYIRFKLIGGFYGLKMTFCIIFNLLPLLYKKNESQLKGIPLFLFTLPCFGIRK